MLAFLHDEDADLVRALQVGKRLGDGSRRLPAAIPSYRNGVERHDDRLLGRDEQDMASGAIEQVFDQALWRSSGRLAGRRRRYRRLAREVARSR
jgi:hypothetical protein